MPKWTRGALLGSVDAANRAGEQRQGARFPRRRSSVTPQLPAEAIAEVDVGDGSRPEELVEIGLEALERPCRGVELEHQPQTACATWRMNRTPSSRSATGIRSFAEWMSRAAVSESSSRAGKKP